MADNINIQEVIRERFAGLPQKLQEAIRSAEVAEKLRSLAQEYRLHIDQGQILENETYMVLLGIEKAENYENNLKKELGIPAEQAEKIAGEVGDQIFHSVRDLFREATTRQDEGEQQNKVQTPPPPPQPVSTEETAQPKPAPQEQGKLSGVVRKQSKNVDVGASQGKTHNVDPYREPIE